MSVSMLTRPSSTTVRLMRRVPALPVKSRRCPSTMAVEF
jgi:hypothetical protein